MKASELRIGNYLQDSITKTTLEVIQLNNNGISTYVIDRSKYPLKEGWKLEPILLTEQWLLKFGFHLRDGFSNAFKLNVEKHQYDCSEITYSEKEGLLRFSNGQEKGATLIPHIKYAHQLQNLYFALTGEELTLNQDL